MLAFELIFLIENACYAFLTALIQNKDKKYFSLL